MNWGLGIGILELDINSAVWFTFGIWAWKLDSIPSPLRSVPVRERAIPSLPPRKRSETERSDLHTVSRQETEAASRSCPTLLPAAPTLLPAGGASLDLPLPPPPYRRRAPSTFPAFCPHPALSRRLLFVDANPAAVLAPGGRLLFVGSCSPTRIPTAVFIPTVGPCSPERIPTAVLVPVVGPSSPERIPAAVLVLAVGPSFAGANPAIILALGHRLPSPARIAAAVLLLRPAWRVLRSNPLNRFHGVVHPNKNWNWGPFLDSNQKYHTHPNK